MRRGAGGHLPPQIRAKFDENSAKIRANSEKIRAEQAKIHPKKIRIRTHIMLLTLPHTHTHMQQTNIPFHAANVQNNSENKFRPFMRVKPF